MPLGARRMRSTNGWPAVARPKRTTDMPLDARRTRSTNAWGAVKRAKRTTDMPLDALPLWVSKDSPALARPKRKTNMPHGYASHLGQLRAGKTKAQNGNTTRRASQWTCPWMRVPHGLQRIGLPWQGQRAKRTCPLARVEHFLPTALASSKRKTDMPLVTRRTRASIGVAWLGQAKAQVGHAIGRASNNPYQRLAFLGQPKARKDFAL